MGRRRTRLALCGSALLAAAASAVAEEYCVVCTQPGATYRCVVDDPVPTTAVDARSQMICITELAKEGGHESCSVRRAASGPCEGVLRTVSPPLADPPEPIEEAAPSTLPPADVPPPAVPPAVTEMPPPAMPEATPAQEVEHKKSKEPKTVEELAKQTLESSKKGLEKAGDAVGSTAESAGSAVGNAAKKTWTCLTSLFQDC
jgi:hypothetical protein